MWIITTQASQNINSDTEDFKSYGALIASLVDSVGSILKSLMVFVMLHQSQSNGEHPQPHISGTSKDDAQSLLEAIYRTRLINCLVESFRL